MFFGFKGKAGYFIGENGKLMRRYTDGTVVPDITILETKLMIIPVFAGLAGAAVAYQHPEIFSAPDGWQIFTDMAKNKFMAAKELMLFPVLGLLWGAKFKMQKRNQITLNQNHG